MTRTYFVGVLAAALAACGDDGGAAPDAAVTADAPVDAVAVDPALEGVWRAACTADNDATVELTIAGDVVTEVATTFLDTNPPCTEPLAVLTHRMTYTLRGPGEDGVTKWDRRTESITTEPKNAAEVADWNTRSYCGYSDWTLSVAKEISGRGCNVDGQDIAVFPVGFVYYTVYKIVTTTDTRLHLGDPSSGGATTESTRETRVRATSNLVKQ